MPGTDQGSRGLPQQPQAGQPGQVAEEWQVRGQGQDRRHGRPAPRRRGGAQVPQAPAPEAHGSCLARQAGPWPQEEEPQSARSGAHHSRAEGAHPRSRQCAEDAGTVERNK